MKINWTHPSHFLVDWNETREVDRLVIQRGIIGLILVFSDCFSSPVSMPYATTSLM
jgi:hypothetical protein